MAKIDSRTLLQSLKNGNVSRIYYLFGADVMGVEKMTKKIVKYLTGGNEDFALTKIEGKKLDFYGLSDIVRQFPMFSEYNCVLINDYNCEKPLSEMNGRSADDVTKRLIEILKEISEQTVVIFNVTGFEIKVQRDFKSGKNIIKDKNKKLADFAEKNGTVCEFPIKTSSELAKIISAKVASRGGSIALKYAQNLAEMCLCDELVIENEIEKLCSFANGREIDMEMINSLISARNETTIYNLASAVVSMNAAAAFRAVDELNVNGDNRTLVLYAITGAFLDLYRAACAKRAGVGVDTVVADFDYGRRSFVVRNAFRDCSRISVERLRRCIIILRDTTVMLNSSAADPRIAIEKAITEMLTTRDRGC